MKFLLGMFAGIFLTFAGLSLVGFFLPESQVVEHTAEIDGYSEDMFPLINNLKLYSAWTLRANYGTSVSVVYGGPDYGTGQTSVWQSQEKPVTAGTVEIRESEAPHFVRSVLSENGDSWLQTFALKDIDDGKVSVLLRAERHLGGFPYLRRIAAKVSDHRIQKRHRAVLENFKSVASQSGSPDA